VSCIAGEDQLLLGLQSDRVLPPVRRPGLPLRQASEAQLPDQGGCHQDHDPGRKRDHGADQPTLMGKNHSKLLNGSQPYLDKVLYTSAMCKRVFGI
jgi:hypothetical protein